MINAPLAALVNGTRDDRIAVADRGLQYGDGVFETLAVADGEILLWQAHFARLARGCERLQVACPPAALLATEAVTVSRGHARAVLKIVVTRGIGARGYRPVTDVPPTRIVSAWPWPTYPATHWRDGIRLYRCRTALAIQPLLAGIKHLNRLEQVLARAEWSDDYAEGAMADTDDRVIAGTMSNLFAITDAGIVTPALARCGVRGIMRGCVLDTAAALGMRADETSLSWEAMAAAAGLFVTNSVIGLWPVAEFNGRRYPIHETYKTLHAEIVQKRYALALDA